MRKAITAPAPSLELPQQQAIQETFRLERRKLLDFIRRRTPSEDDAEDVLQDVFYQLLYSYPTIESLEKVTSWLFTVARNKITDFYRKKRPEPVSRHMVHTGDEEPLNLIDILPDLAGSPDEMMLRQRVLETLEVALAELPEDQREVFILHEFEHKSFKEISRLSGAPVNTLLSRKRYAVLHLRERLRFVYQEWKSNPL
ncbi:MAG: RNA polymerase sigma factor [Bacteroidia bacterium]|jgi:RNA polymerase sigma factor (sigma-70 family)|nr:RNA polymerase sigma factor [Bacteroidia bacterium]